MQQNFYTQVNTQLQLAAQQAVRRKAAEASKVLQAKFKLANNQHPAKAAS